MSCPDGIGKTRSLPGLRRGVVEAKRGDPIALLDRRAEAMLVDHRDPVLHRSALVGVRRVDLAVVPRQPDADVRTRLPGHSHTDDRPMPIGGSSCGVCIAWFCAPVAEGILSFGVSDRKTGSLRLRPARHEAAGEAPRDGVDLFARTVFSTAENG